MKPSLVSTQLTGEGVTQAHLLKYWSLVTVSVGLQIGQRWIMNLTTSLWVACRIELPPLFMIISGASPLVTPDAFSSCELGGFWAWNYLYLGMQIYYSEYGRVQSETAGRVSLDDWELAAQVYGPVSNYIYCSLGFECILCSRTLSTIYRNTIQHGQADLTCMAKAFILSYIYNFVYYVSPISSSSSQSISR